LNDKRVARSINDRCSVGVILIGIFQLVVG